MCFAEQYSESAYVAAKPGSFLRVLAVWAGSVTLTGLGITGWSSGIYQVYTAH